MSHLSEYLPRDKADILQMEPDEIAAAMIVWLHNYENTREVLSVHAMGQYLIKIFDRELAVVLMEGWSVLVQTGLLIPKPEASGSPVVHYVFSRRGREIGSKEAFGAIRFAKKLQRESLHPLIAEDVWADFIRADYESAVFKAYKRVEIAVRAAGGFGANEIGVPLMRAAFNPTSGPLRDASLTGGEPQAINDLYAGALGWFKNPGSHRDVVIDQDTAVEAIGFASYLMRYLDTRITAIQAGAPPASF